MLLTQEVKGGINLVQLHLDPDRKGESFAGLPRVTTLRARPGAAPVAQKAALRWVGADTLAVEVPLEGGETAVTAVEVPGQRAVSLPPVCLPYSAEFKPARGDRGLAALERLALATGGKERLELAGLWKDLPRRPRLLSLGRWLLGLAVAVLLLEVLERRTGLLTRRRRLAGEGGGGPAVARRRLFRRRPRPAAVPAEGKPLPAPAAPQREAAKRPAAPAEAEAEPGVVEALRKARERIRGRLE
jgi:hypothetical protein